MDLGALHTASEAGVRQLQHVENRSVRVEVVEIFVWDYRNNRWKDMAQIRPSRNLPKFCITR